MNKQILLVIIARYISRSTFTFSVSYGILQEAPDAQKLIPRVMMSQQSCLCFVSVKCCGAVHGAAPGAKLTAAMLLLNTMHIRLNKQTNNMCMDTFPVPYSCPLY